jgi:hypothetical protein
LAVLHRSVPLHRPVPVQGSAMPEASHRRRSLSYYHRYNRTPGTDFAAAQAEKIRKLLRDDRQRIGLNASNIRALTVRLNQQIGQALCDGMKVTSLSEASALSRWTVRTIGLSSDDLVPSGLPAEHHLAVIAGLKSELAELEEWRTVLEQRRLNLLAVARRLDGMDDYELAALSGLQHEAIRKMT